MKKVSSAVALVLVTFASGNVLANKCKTACYDQGRVCIESCYGVDDDLVSKTMYESSTGFGDNQPSNFSPTESDGKFVIGGVEYNIKGQETYENGRIASSTTYNGNSGNGTTLKYSYDSNGNVTTTASNETHYNYEYDANGNVTQKSNPWGSGYYTYEYDDHGNVTKEVGPYGYTQSWGYEYDDKGNITKKTNSWGGYYTYEYDENGNKIKETGPSGYGYTYDYDKNGNQIGYSYTSERNYEYEYTDDGYTKKVISGNGYYESEYDKDGHLLREVSPYGYTYTYEYDDHGNRIGQSYSSSYYTYEYDDNGRITKQTNPYGSSYAFEYDENGNVQRRRIRMAVIMLMSMMNKDAWLKKILAMVVRKHTNIMKMVMLQNLRVHGVGMVGIILMNTMRMDIY